MFPTDPCTLANRFFSSFRLHVHELAPGNQIRVYSNRQKRQVQEELVTLELALPKTPIGVYFKATEELAHPSSPGVRVTPISSCFLGIENAAALTRCAWTVG